MSLLITAAAWYLVAAIVWTFVRACVLVGFYDRGELYRLEVRRRLLQHGDNAMQALLWPVSVAVHVDLWIGERPTLRWLVRQAFGVTRIALSVTCAVYFIREPLLRLAFLALVLGPPLIIEVAILLLITAAFCKSLSLHQFWWPGPLCVAYTLLAQWRLAMKEELAN